MGPTWVLSAPDGHHVDPMDLAIRVKITVHRLCWFSSTLPGINVAYSSTCCAANYSLQALNGFLKEHYVDSLPISNDDQGLFQPVQVRVSYTVLQIESLVRYFPFMPCDNEMSKYHRPWFNANLWPREKYNWNQIWYQWDFYYQTQGVLHFYASCGFALVCDRCITETAISYSMPLKYVSLHIPNVCLTTLSLF